MYFKKSVDVATPNFTEFVNKHMKLQIKPVQIANRKRMFAHMDLENEFSELVNDIIHKPLLNECTYTTNDFSLNSNRLDVIYFHQLKCGFEDLVKKTELQLNKQVYNIFNIRYNMVREILGFIRFYLFRDWLPTMFWKICFVNVSLYFDRL